jgi:PTS system fructose-specific IIC component
MDLKISELLAREAIILQLAGKEKMLVIQELAEHLVNKDLIVNKDEFLSAIAKRENLESTGIGNGIAIPHARTNAVKNLVLAFGRSEAGVDFSSIDGRPSHLIFMIVSPEEKKSDYIKTLAKISRLVRKEEVRSLLRSARKPDEIMDIIKANE